MGLLLRCGFELNSSTAGVEWDTYNLATVSNTIARSGTYSLRVNAASTTPFWRAVVRSSDSATAICYLTFSLYIASGPSADAQIARILNSSNVQQAIIRLTTGNQLQLYNGSVAQVGSNSGTLSTNTQYVVELAWNPATGATSAKLDGTQFASGTGTTGSWSRVLLGIPTGTLNCDLYFDDVGVNDDAGSFENTFMGLDKLLYMRPNANGDNTGMNNGVPDATNHYLNVNEVSPDGDTSYNQSATAGQIDDYNMEPSGLSAGDTIKSVCVGIRYRKVTSGTLVFKVRIKAAAAGTVETSSNISSATTTFNTNAESTPRLYPLVLYDLPGASTTPWAASDLDTAQIGAEVVSNTANNWRYTTMWMIVQYTPAVGGSQIKKIMGTTQATVKEIGNLAIASVKKVASVTNV